MISTTSPFNSPFWLSFKTQKVEWILSGLHDFSSMAPTTRFPIFTIIEINDSIQSLIGHYFAIIDLATALLQCLF